MKLVTRFLTLAALLLLSVATVNADSGQTVSYTLSGPTDATFTISMGTSTSPTPEDSGQNYFFMVQPTGLVVDGTSMSDTIVFFNSSDFGGLNSVFDALPDLGGPQLYSGNESDPTLLTGVFSLYDLETGASYTLTANAVSAPEPATVLMLVAGLFLVVMGLKRRSANLAHVN
jgi:hypothetical protein